jgi:uncharacterized protein (TIGR00730 family)
MHPLHRICVFCGANAGNRPEYRAAAQAMGRLLAEAGIGLVYGGGHTGMMGAIADAVLEGGGEVIGIIPRHLEEREMAHQGLTDLRVVGSMHERKALMEELSDAFIGMPGGLGTLEEFFEIATWNQLGIIDKPMGLLDVLGYYDAVRRFLDHAVHQGFMLPRDRELVVVSEDPGALLAALQSKTATGRESVLERPER